MLLTALPDIGSILVNFDPQHPVISHFLTQTKGNADAMQVSLDQVSRAGAVPRAGRDRLQCGDAHFQLLRDLPESEQKRCILSFALLQMLAVQHELEEPLDLSGSFLAELISRRVVFAGGQNDAVLTAM